MLLSIPLPVLLACVTSLLCTCLQHASALVYRGCAYRAVAGKQQALWFCLADNLCAMFHCQDNSVFSADDCGCVPVPHQDDLHPTPTTTTSIPTSPSPSASTDNSRKDSSSSSSNGQVGERGGSHRQDLSSTHRTTGLTQGSTTPTVLHSASGTISNRRPPPGCQADIHIEGVTARVPSGRNSNSSNSNNNNNNNHSNESQKSVSRVEPRGVQDLGNGSAVYDGYSFLALPAYTDARFDSGLTIDFVLEEGTSVRRQVLVTNCNHGEGASVEVVMDVELGVMVFHVMYRFRKALNAVESVLQVAVPYTAFVPKRVVLVFDGRHLRGRVNNSEKSARVQGNGDYVLAQRRKPLLFGNTLCDVDHVYGYRGQIRQISVYRCAKSLPALFS